MFLAELHVLCFLIIMRAMEPWRNCGHEVIDGHIAAMRRFARHVIEG